MTLQLKTTFMQEAREYYALEQLWGDAKLSVYED